ncbi:MAG: molybdate ABC transporter substrate-binding protein [Deltaproteobacteria bacterium]
MYRELTRRRLRGVTAAAVMLAFVIALCAGAGSGRANDGARSVTVFAAASLKNVLDDAAKVMQSKGRARPIVSFAASSALAKQIEQGAPADIFISADSEWMDYLATKNLIRPETRTIVATNSLVLIAPAASTANIELKPGAGLTALLGEGRLAVADVKAVPAGKYAKAALESLRIWPELESRLAQSENVRAALALVSRGEAPLGIVYGSDARSDPSVRIVAVFPASTHPAIVYPAAVTADAHSPDAAASLIRFLTSPEGRTVLSANGFGLPD